MLIDQVKQTKFEQKTYEDWQEVAVQSLRGLPFEKLVTKTIEGIDLFPLYTSASPKLQSLQAIRQAQRENGWVVAQQHYTTDATVFLQNLRVSLERGNEAIVYDGSNPIEWDEATLKELHEYVLQYPIYFLKVSKKDKIVHLFNEIANENRQNVVGVVELEETSMLKDFPHIRTISADVVDAHHKGADAVTELALILAEAAEQAEKLGDFKTVSEQLFVRMAIDTHFFMEIAKIRAFRVLWEALSHAYEEPTEHIPVLSETSKRSYSTLDPYVNLLRAGNSAFSAILGGTDVLTVHPHNVLTEPNATSIRLARNIQLVIKEETEVNGILDPSGGSYFIEALTKELVEKAWVLFIDIDAAGGYSYYISSSEYEERLNKCYESRLADLAKGKHSLVGTSVYADLTSDEKIEPVVAVDGRLAAPFENFRQRFKKAQPKVGLVTFGLLKDFKPRADFVSGFLATGGIETISSPELATVTEALDWLQQENIDYAIICATNERTLEVVPQLLQNKAAHYVVDVAGKYDAELSNEWLDAGLNGFIYMGLNKLEKFAEIEQQMKGDDVHA